MSRLFSHQYSPYCLEGVSSRKLGVVLPLEVKSAVLRENLESYPQQMEHQDDQPPNHTADSADKYVKEVDRYRRRNEKVCQEQEYQANDGVNGQSHQQRGCSRE